MIPLNLIHCLIQIQTEHLMRSQGSSEDPGYELSHHSLWVWLLCWFLVSGFVSLEFSTTHYYIWRISWRNKERGRSVKIWQRKRKVGKKRKIREEKSKIQNSWTNEENVSGKQKAKKTRKRISYRTTKGYIIWDPVLKMFFASPQVAMPTGLWSSSYCIETWTYGWIDNL